METKMKLNVTFSMVSGSVQAVMVYLCTPLMEEADTLRLSILICLRVKTAVTWLSRPAKFSEWTMMVYSLFSISVLTF